MAAVSELQAEYEGVDFNVITPEQTAARASELETYELGSHGLVAFSASGEVRAHLPGHEFGRDEIVEAVEAALD